MRKARKTGWHTKNLWRDRVLYFGVMTKPNSDLFQLILSPMDQSLPGGELRFGVATTYDAAGKSSS